MPIRMQLTEAKYANTVYEQGPLGAACSRTIEGVADVAFPNDDSRHLWRSMFRVARAQLDDYRFEGRKLYRHADQFEDLIAGRSLRAVLEMEKTGSSDDHKLFDFLDWSETYKSMVIEEGNSYA